VNNLSSNVLVIQKIKFSESEKIKSPVSISSGTAQPPSLGLNIRKVRVMNQSVDKNFTEKHKEKNHYFNKSSNSNINNHIVYNNNNNNSNSNSNFNSNSNAYNENISNRRSLNSGRLNLNISKKKSNDNNNNINNNFCGNNLHVNKDSEKLEAEETSNLNVNINTNKNKNINLQENNNFAPVASNGNPNSNVVSPIMNMPLIINKSKQLPSITNKNASMNKTMHKNSNIGIINNTNYSGPGNNPNDVHGSPGKIRMGFINRFRYNNEGNSLRHSLNGAFLNNNQIQEENSGNNNNQNDNNTVVENTNTRYEGSPPNTKKNGLENKIEKSALMPNNPYMKAYLVFYLSF